MIKPICYICRFYHKISGKKKSSKGLCSILKKDVAGHTWCEKFIITPKVTERVLTREALLKITSNSIDSALTAFEEIYYNHRDWKRHKYWDEFNVVKAYISQTNEQLKDLVNKLEEDENA